jgi:hypothetical protein
MISTASATTTIDNNVAIFATVKLGFVQPKLLTPFSSFQTAGSIIIISMARFKVMTLTITIKSENLSTIL